MQKRTIALWLLLPLAGIGWSQEQSTTVEADSSAEEAPAADTAPVTDSGVEDGALNEESDLDSQTYEEDDELNEESDLDSQTYEEDDDDFVPTEEIPADEPIPFPSNI